MDKIRDSQLSSLEKTVLIQITGHKDKGNVIISRLNEGILSSLASNVGGFYVGATQDSSDLKKVVAYIERMEKEKFDDKKIQSLQEQYHYFIGIALLCFILEWFL